MRSQNNNKSLKMIHLPKLTIMQDLITEGEVTPCIYFVLLAPNNPNEVFISCDWITYYYPATVIWLVACKQWMTDFNQRIL